LSIDFSQCSQPSAKGVLVFCLFFLPFIEFFPALAISFHSSEGVSFAPIIGALPQTVCLVERGNEMAWNETKSLGNQSGTQKRVFVFFFGRSENMSIMHWATPIFLLSYLCISLSTARSHFRGWPRPSLFPWLEKKARGVARKSAGKATRPQNICQLISPEMVKCSFLLTKYIAN